MWWLTVRATLSQHQESHGSHGNFYEGEQEQCCSVPVGTLYGGLRISQWHKLCWSVTDVLASLWLDPLVSQGSQEVFLVPPPTPTYLLRLHIYIGAFVCHFNGVVVLVLLFFNYSLIELRLTFSSLNMVQTVRRTILRFLTGL